MRYAIVGAGPAGVVAAETLRKADPDGEVKLIGDEPERPYSRMAIPYLLMKKITEEGTHLRHGSGHYDKRRIEVLQERVSSVDPINKRLTLGNHQTVDYDRLLIATGARPITPPVPGMDLPGVHNCWTLADARHIMRLAEPEARVVLIGAGFIGCIVLEALVKRGVKLTVVEMGDRMVPRMMTQSAGNLIRTWCEAKGVEVYTSTRVTGIQAGGKSGIFRGLMNAVGLSKEQSHRQLEVFLDNGQVLEADLVILAVGVKSNIDFLTGSNVETQHGIMINPDFQTSVPDVYAAGDVAQGRDFSTGGYEVHAIQPTATDHGRVAAMNMAGIATKYRGSLNMNVLDTMGLIASSFGLWMGTEGGETAEACEPQRFRYISLQFQDDILVGATSLGITQHVGVLRGLIQGRVRLGQWKDKLLQDPTRVMEAYLAKNHLS